MQENFPRIIIAATQSGAGKTTIVSGILAALKKRGLDVQAYKVGPDYIDTGFHEVASGKPSHNLDSWLVGEKKLEEIFFYPSNCAKIAVIEGVMGLYDGGVGGVSSTAEIAQILRSPVVLVIDVKSIGTSAAAIALGFREFDKNINLAGVILNRVGSDSHKKLIVEALEKINIKCFGAIKRDTEFILPERHLGLVPTAENNFAEVIEKICVAVEKQVDIDAFLEIANSAPSSAPSYYPPTHLSTYPPKIAVAKDAAFNFYYEESLRVLEKLGAEIVYFSPLDDEKLPENISGLIIGGGFPEMFASQLQENKKIRLAIREAAENNLPIYAECGGFMYLMESMTDYWGGFNFEMCGVIPARAFMTDKLQTVGYIDAEILNDCVIGRAGDKIHAHEFHFSTAEILTDKNLFTCKRMRTGKTYRAGYAQKNIAASYLHIHFAGCTSAAENFIATCIKHQRQSNLQ